MRVLKKINTKCFPIYTPSPAAIYSGAICTQVINQSLVSREVAIRHSRLASDEMIYDIPPRRARAAPQPTAEQTA
ncbi:hypothetical protein EVAR_46443_1 [Eumeta japonica]|uniref:Uncharacterized protein n=1 Tax=Eumeta variegata TaxID=151549 RepID=A0A4C1XF29_EUMVA|nr:hypothetical protein EVAR_46443_1 [Eumeta japonica]